MNDLNRRTDSIRVRLSPDMMTRFEELADRYGMPPATLAAFAIARFVQQDENNLNIARDALNRMADKSLDVEVSEDAIAKAFAAVLPALVQSGALTSEQLQNKLAG